LDKVRDLIRHCVAEPAVDIMLDLGAQPALAAPDRVIVIFFGCAGAVLAGPDDGAVDHGVFVVGVTGELLKQALRYPLFGPAAKPPVRVLPIPEPLRQLALRNSGAVSVVENGFDESAIISASDTDIAGLSGKQVLDSLLLVMAKCISVHGSALFKADSQRIT
jgi:hypothetical protein